MRACSIACTPAERAIRPGSLDMGYIAALPLLHVAIFSYVALPVRIGASEPHSVLKIWGDVSTQEGFILCGSCNLFSPLRGLSSCEFRGTDKQNPMLNLRRSVHKTAESCRYSQKSFGFEGTHVFTLVSSCEDFLALVLLFRHRYGCVVVFA